MIMYCFLHALVDCGMTGTRLRKQGNHHFSMESCFYLLKLPSFIASIFPMPIPTCRRDTIMRIYKWRRLMNQREPESGSTRSLLSVE